MTSNDPEKARVLEAAHQILAGAGSDSPIKVSDLVSRIRSTTKVDRADKRIYYDLLESSNDEGSRILSRKGPRGGYYLSDVPPTDEVETDQKLIDEKTYERHLYDLVFDWVDTKRKSTPIKTPNLRRGGTWSNPDLICLQEISGFGIYDIEIQSIEVKTSLYKWKSSFFQTAAYRDISNRVYFVFRDSGARSNHDRAELQKCAERYGIGLVEMKIEKADYDTLPRYNRFDYKKKMELIETFDELLPAPYTPLPPGEKVDLLTLLANLQPDGRLSFQSSRAESDT